MKRILETDLVEKVIKKVFGQNNAYLINIDKEKYSYEEYDVHLIICLFHINVNNHPLIDDLKIKVFMPFIYKDDYLDSFLYKVCVAIYGYKNYTEKINTMLTFPTPDDYFVSESEEDYDNCEKFLYEKFTYIKHYIFDTEKCKQLIYPKDLKYYSFLPADYIIYNNKNINNGVYNKLFQKDVNNHFIKLTINIKNYINKYVIYEFFDYYGDYHDIKEEVYNNFYQCSLNNRVDLMLIIILNAGDMYSFTSHVPEDFHFAVRLSHYDTKAANTNLLLFDRKYYFSIYNYDIEKIERIFRELNSILKNYNNLLLQKD